MRAIWWLVAVLILVFTTLGIAAHVSATEPVQAPAPVSPAAPVSAVRDYLTADYWRVPPQLWDALIRDGWNGRDDGTDDLLYVPIGTVVNVAGGLYLATYDGWAVCRDNHTVPGVECSATGPVVLIPYP